MQECFVGDRPVADAHDEQQRCRGVSQTAAPAGHCTSRRSSPRARPVLTAAPRAKARAAADGPLFAQTRSRDWQQAPAVTPAIAVDRLRAAVRAARLALSLCHARATGGWLLLRPGAIV